MGVVYKVTSQTSGKSYIGMCTIPYKWRKSTHLYRARSGNTSAFYKALRKYGEEDFVWEIIKESDNTDELIALEKSLIEELETYYPNGYNMTLGGYENEGLIVTVDVKNKISISMSEAMKGNTNFQGHAHSNSNRRKWAKIRGKPVRCLNNGKVYPSIREAYIDTKTNDRYVRDCCNGDKIRDPGHSKWQFVWATKEEVNVEPKLWEERGKVK